MAITLDTTTSTITIDGTGSSQGTVRFYENTGNGTNFVGLAAPASVTTNVTFSLPAADGTTGQVLQTNGSGSLSFAQAGINTGKSVAVAYIFGL